MRGNSRFDVCVGQVLGKINPAPYSLQEVLSQVSIKLFSIKTTSEFYRIGSLHSLIRYVSCSFVVKFSIFSNLSKHLC